jgi:hypothetical protein
LPRLVAGGDVEDVALIGACLIVVALSACRSASDVPDPSPSEMALEQCRRRIDRSADRAFEASESREVYTVSIRFNPARCPSPPFELFVHGKWTRAYLETRESPVEERLEAFQRRASRSDTFERTSIEATPDGRRETETGLSFPVFSVRSLLNR